MVSALGRKTKKDLYGKHAARMVGRTQVSSHVTSEWRSMSAGMGLQEGASTVVAFFTGYPPDY